MQRIVYPGTFDPITNGHVDIVLRAERLFDEVIIAIAQGSHKHTLLSLDERVMLVEKLLKTHKNITIKSYNGLLVDFLHQEKTNLILRGVRNTLDYIQECQLAGMNAKLDSSIETIFLPTKETHACISSSIVRDIIKKGQSAAAFVPPEINDYLQKHIYE
jgi:pantetheine-phosphate adenylyltransferase